MATVDESLGRTCAADNVDAMNPHDTTEVFRVAIFARMPDPDSLATILCEVLNLRRLDATIIARHTPGVLPLRMNTGLADKLVAALRSTGVTATAVSAAELPDLAQARMIHHARLLEDGFEVLDLHGKRVELLPWSRIGVIAVGSIPGASTHRYVEQGRPSVVSAAPLPEVSRVNTADHDTLELWLMDRQSRTAYRFHHDRFNYEGLGDERTESATTNFGRFARGITKRAVTARWTPSTHAYHAHEIARYAFPSSEELQQHVLLAWVLDRSACESTQNTDSRRM